MYLYLQQEEKVYGKSGLMFEKHKATQTVAPSHYWNSRMLLSTESSLLAARTYVPTRNVPKSSITGNFTYFANVSVDHSSHGHCWSIKVLSTGFNVALLLVWLFLSWGSGTCFVLTSCEVVWGQLVFSKPQVHTAPCGSCKVLHCSNVDLKIHQ